MEKLPLLYRVRLKVLKQFLTKKEGLLLLFAKRGYLLSSGWFESMKTNQSIDREKNPIPWITYPAFHFLHEMNFEGKRIFEYGSGNSTLYFTGRGAEVYSVEHHKGWYETVKTRIKNPERLYYRSLEQKEEADLYVRAAAEPTLKYDAVIVDGRYRKRCLFESINHLTEGGVVILDNSDRPYYKPGIDFLLSKGFRKIDFHGLSPIGYLHSSTTIFYKSGNWLNI